MTMAMLHAVNMSMGFVVLFTFSTSFSSLENHIMHPVNIASEPINLKSMPALMKAA